MGNGVEKTDSAAVHARRVPPDFQVHSETTVAGAVVVLVTSTNGGRVVVVSTQTHIYIYIMVGNEQPISKRTWYVAQENP